MIKGFDTELVKDDKERDILLSDDVIDVPHEAISCDWSN